MYITWPNLYLHTHTYICIWYLYISLIHIYITKENMIQFSSSQIKECPSVWGLLDGQSPGLSGTQKSCNILKSRPFEKKRDPSHHILSLFKLSKAKHYVLYLYTCHIIHMNSHWRQEINRSPHILQCPYGALCWCWGHAQKKPDNNKDGADH